MDEHEAEAAAVSIYDYIFCVDNTSGVGFLNSTEKSVTITDPTTAHAMFLILLFARLLTLRPLLIEHQILFISSNFLCAYLTIPPLLSLIFRFRSLLLFTINHRCLSSMQPSAI